MVIMGGLGAILGPLGAILRATWADLGPTWAPKRAQKGAQDDPKTTPKRYRFFDRFLVRFWCDFGVLKTPKTSQNTPRRPRILQDAPTRLRSVRAAPGSLVSCCASYSVFALQKVN